MASTERLDTYELGDEAHTTTSRDKREAQKSQKPVEASQETKTDELDRQDQATTTKGDSNEVEEHKSVSNSSKATATAQAPPLPEESMPPLPTEAPAAVAEDDDGWAPIWEDSSQAFYFYNRFTGATQWTNPRVPGATLPGPPGVEPIEPLHPTQPARPAGGYDPAIHGDYDPNAWYAQQDAPEESTQGATDPAAAYAATENFNDENKSKRQMNAFFDVDAAANSHDGRSLKAERSGKKLTKDELKNFKEKRKAKKEEKRRAWLRD